MSFAVCGLTLTSSVGTVTSPHFPEMYQNNLSCYTEIVAPSDKRIALTIQEYDIENCCDNLQMYDRINGSDHLAAQLSGWSRQVKSLYSYSNEIKLVFKTDGSGVGKGFFASYRFFNSSKEKFLYKINYTTKPKFNISPIFNFLLWK